MAHPKAAELAGTLQAHPHFDKARGLLLQAATPKAQIVGGRCDGGAWLPSLLRCSPCCIALPLSPPPKPNHHPAPSALVPCAACCGSSAYRGSTRS